jgi:cation transport ATPase
VAVLSLERPEEILSIIKLSKTGYQRMLHNLFWAVG